jgi:hypothetical protein
MMRGEGFLGDYGPLSSRNVFLFLSILGTALTLTFLLAATPWWPWPWPAV